MLANLLNIIRPGRRRQLKGGWLTLFTIFGLGLGAYQVYSLFFRYDPLIHRAIFYSFILVLAFLAYTFNEGSKDYDPPSILKDIFCAILSASAGVYFFLNMNRLVSRWTQVDALLFWDLFFGLIFVILTLEVTRRIVGMPLFVFIIFMVIYSVYGPYMPFGLAHRGMSFVRLIDQYAFDTTGIFAIPLGTVSTIVYAFVLFGTVMEKSGGSEFLFRFSKAIAGRAVGGPAKVSIVASALYGSISGSPASNVVTTGVVTIPIMQRLG